MTTIKAPADFLYDIDLSYDKTKLLDEMNNVDFTPFNDAGLPIQGVDRQSKIHRKSWFYNPSTWLQGHVINECPEVSKVQSQICELLECKDIRPRYYKQEKDTEVPMHPDRGTLCAINIILSDNYGPLIFGELGPVSYNCALLNLEKRHAVPAFPEERVLLKFSIFDVPYKKALSNYRINSLKENL